MVLTKPKIPTSCCSKIPHFKQKWYTPYMCTVVLKFAAWSFRPSSNSCAFLLLQHLHPPLVPSQQTCKKNPTRAPHLCEHNSPSQTTQPNSAQQQAQLVAAAVLLVEFLLLAHYLPGFVLQDWQVQRTSAGRTLSLLSLLAKQFHKVILKDLDVFMSLWLCFETLWPPLQKTKPSTLHSSPSIMGMTLTSLSDVVT